MDPQATLQRIAEAVATANLATVDQNDPDMEALEQARQDYTEACAELCSWLRHGGHAPSVSRAGITQFIPGTGTQYAILSPEPAEITGVKSLLPHWEIVKYNEKGGLAERHHLAD